MPVEGCCEGARPKRCWWARQETNYRHFQLNKNSYLGGLHTSIVLQRCVTDGKPNVGSGAGHEQQFQIAEPRSFRQSPNEDNVMVKLMRSKMLLLVACALTLPGCDQSRRTVGRSYNECLLINLKSGAGGAAGLVYQACRREFERPKALPLEGTFKLVKPSYGPHRLEGFIRNPSDDEIATAEKVTITFYKDASAKEEVATYSWDLMQDIICPFTETLFGQQELQEIFHGVNKK